MNHQKDKNQLGMFNPWLILVIVVILGGGLVLGKQYNPWLNLLFSGKQGPAPTVVQTPVSSAGTTPQQVQKGDLAALEKYCMEEALKLPEASFTYKTKEGPTKSGPMPWVDKYIPKDIKQAGKKSCTMAYKFDGRPAYSSVGTTYPGGLIEFKKVVFERFAAKLDSSWERIKTDEQIFKRENPQMGTVDFVDIFDGGLVIYIKFNTYYK